MNPVAAIAMILWSPAYIVPVGIGSFIVWRLWRIRPKLNICDWLLFVLPWFVWFPSLFVSPQQKSLANLTESYIVVAIALVSFVGRMYLGPRIGNKTSAFLALLITCVGGVLVAYFTPTLPE